MPAPRGLADSGEVCRSHFPNSPRYRRSSKKRVPDPVNRAEAVTLQAPVERLHRGKAVP